LTLLAADRYNLDDTVLPGVLRVKSSSSYLSLNRDYEAPVQVVINTGVWAPLPSRVQLAMLMFLTTAYETRPSVVTGTIASEIPDGAKALLDSLRIWKI
jgi:hypothetical protein